MPNTKHIIAFLLIVICLLESCSQPHVPKPVMLYNGVGASQNDVQAVADILSLNGVDVEWVDEKDLNKLDSTGLSKRALLIIPGGNFIEMGEAINPPTLKRVQAAVQHGLNYLGICAGGFLAGDTRKNSFELTTTHFPFYADEARGVRKEIIAISGADGKVINTYWEDGPVFTGWGEVISKYPDSTAATVQGYVGKGFVVLTGIHAEAPEKWYHSFDSVPTSIQANHKYIASLIRAALHANPLPHF